MSNPSGRAPTLALLIDADNVSAKRLPGILAAISEFGSAGVRRIYGDWTKPGSNAWKSCLLEHSIKPVQQFAYTTGKNATDGAMIIEAMDLLYTGRFDGFCLVSSDSDFTSLASRLREQVTVYGFGERQTPKPFVSACDKFLYLDALEGTQEEIPSAPAAAPAKGRPVAASSRQGSAKAKRSLEDDHLVAIKGAVEAHADDDGWARLDSIGSQMARRFPDFDSRNYGHSRFGDLVGAHPDFETRRPGEGRSPLVRLKAGPAKTPAAPPPAGKEPEAEPAAALPRKPRPPRKPRADEGKLGPGIGFLADPAKSRSAA